MRRFSDSAEDFLDTIAVDSLALDTLAAVPLGRAALGYRGRIDSIRATDDGAGLPAAELESRLIEIGFVEGARVEILHQGVFGRDPIAVRVNDATIALRRREAMAILVRSLDRES